MIELLGQMTVDHLMIVKRKLSMELLLAEHNIVIYSK